MDEPHLHPEAAPRPAPRRRRWPWFVLGAGVLVLAALGVGVWYGRTDEVAGARVRQTVDRLEARLGMRIEHGPVQPVGWTGVEVRDVAIYWASPEGASAPWARVEVVRAYPALGDALLGDLRIADMELEGVSAALEVDQEGSDLQRLQAALLGSSGGGGGGEGEGEGGAALAPEVIRMQRARLQLRDRRSRLPEVVLQSRALEVSSASLAEAGRITLSGDVDVQGLGPGQIDGAFDLRANTVRIGVTLDQVTDLSELVRNAGAAEVFRRARVQARGVEVAWPMALTLREVHLGELGLPWLWPVGAEPHTPTFEAMDAAELGVRLEDGDPIITAQDATAHLQGSGATLRVPLGAVTLRQDRKRESTTVDLKRADAQGSGAAELRVEWDARSEQLSGSARLEALELAPYAPLMPASAVHALSIESGRASGTIQLDALLAEDILDLDVDATLDRGTFRVPALAARTLEDASVGLKGKLQVRRTPARLQLQGGRVRLGELEGSLDAHLEQVEGGLIVKLNLRSPELDGGRLLSSLPRGFAPKLEGYGFEGAYGFNFNLEVDTRDPDALVLDGSLDLSRARVVRFGEAAHIPTLQGDFAMHPAALPEHVQLGPKAEGWTPREEIPDVVIQAITSAEDGRFFEHDGFDPRGIRAALIENIRQLRFARGGSTISQQVIKNLYLSHERTLSRKFQEAVLTWVMEQTLTKERIITLYLNMLHLGPNIYGIRQAARQVFDKHPDRLALREAVFLACILPNPNYFIRLYAQGTIPEDRRVKMHNILRNMHSAGLMGPKTFSRHARLSDDGVISIAPAPKRLVDALAASKEEEAGDVNPNPLKELVPSLTATQE